MPNVASLGPRISLTVAIGATCALGVYVLSGETSPTAQDTRVVERTQVRAVPVVAVAAAPKLAASDEADEEEHDDDAIRGHQSIEDPAEFAFVFSVDGVPYIRLSTDERATARGKPRLVGAGDAFAVIAPVETSAMPAELRVWAGRKVVVDGGCSARVVGFAEVSRVAGEPPGSGDRYDADDVSDVVDGEGDATDADAEPYEEPQWTIESVTDENVVLDGCSGSWARAESYPAAAVAAQADAPALEAAARADLLARSADDPIQADWKDQGGEGDWRDAAEVVSHVYRHALTDESWVIVQARRPGGCGDPGISAMAVYRASDDGSVRRVADLEYAQREVHEVVDLDGDGQPELVMGDAEDLELVDLAGESHSSISVPYHHYGCGC
jgi:hypothetical protein